MTLLPGEGLPACTETFDAFQTISRGFAGGKFLDEPKLPDLPARRERVALLAIWAATSVTVFAMLASFFLGVMSSLRFLLLLAATGLGISALSLTIHIGTQTKGTPGETGDESGIADLFAWALIADPFLGPLAALAVLLFLFLLLVVWLPFLVLVLNLVSLGELWRNYRGALITAEDSRVLGRIGGEFLRAGGVLSRSWDVYLDPTDRALAAERRSTHLRAHYALLALGASSLLLAVEEVLSRAFPSPGWNYLVVGTGAVSAFCFVLFVGALIRRRGVRPKVAPPAAGLPR